MKKNKFFAALAAMICILNISSCTLIAEKPQVKNKTNEETINSSEPVYKKEGKFYKNGIEINYSYEYDTSNNSFYLKNFDKEGYFYADCEYKNINFDVISLYFQESNFYVPKSNELPFQDLLVYSNYTSEIESNYDLYMDWSYTKDGNKYVGYTIRGDKSKCISVVPYKDNNGEIRYNYIVNDYKDKTHSNENPANYHIEFENNEIIRTNIYLDSFTQETIKPNIYSTEFQDTARTNSYVINYDSGLDIITEAFNINGDFLGKIIQTARKNNISNTDEYCVYKYDRNNNLIDIKISFSQNKTVLYERSIKLKNNKIVSDDYTYTLLKKSIDELAKEFGCLNNQDATCAISKGMLLGLRNKK